MNRKTIFTLLLGGLLAVPAGATDRIEFAEEDGTVRTADILSVSKESLEEFRGLGRISGRRKTLRIPSRRIVKLTRGSSEAVNQWSKRLAKARAMIANNQLVTKGTNIGADEILKNMTYSTEKGTPGQEKSERVLPWHQMYALYHLIQVRYLVGKDGDASSLDRGLQEIDQFMKRTDSKSKSIKWKVPFKEAFAEKKIHAWGSTWLKPHVMLLKARILRAKGDKSAATAAYEETVKLVKDKKLSPMVLAAARTEQAEMAAEGKSDMDAEKEYRNAGIWMQGESRRQVDAFGKELLGRAGNRALLHGADLLLASAEKGGGVSVKVPMARYKELRDIGGAKDAALYMGAQTGYGICLVKDEQGEKAYHALLEVAVRGYEYPDHVQRALFYLGKAAPIYAKDLDRSGANGDFVRKAGERWWADLRDRFPGSPWAEKAKTD
ncbi:MAG: hypothetical protein V3T86_01725 [Planctomycetota bacterium]